jgi:arylsulfatase A-like enzyme
VLGALLLAGCGSAAGEQRQPVEALLITVDTLRRDYLSCYGAPAPLTPELDRLAATGAQFLNHYTVMSHTAPTHATLFTGLHPREHGLRKNGFPLNDGLPSLPAALRQAGYRTGAAIGAKVLGSSFGFDRGFESFDEDFSELMVRPGGASGKHERHAESVIDAAERFLTADDGRPVFLWVHLYDPHRPYLPPATWRRPPDARFVPTVPRSERFTRQRMRDELVAYADEVAYVDRQVGDLLEAWKAHVLRGPNLVVLTSDHGEGLFEHEYPGHGFFLYEEQLRVPLLIRRSDVVPAQTRVEALTSAVDLAATIFALLELEPPAGLGGRSLLPLLGTGARAPGARGPSEHLEVAIAERRRYTDFELQKKQGIVEFLDGGPGSGTGDLISIVVPGWKAIWSEDGPFELYDLAADPDERSNLADEQPERAAAFLAQIEAWRLATREGVEGDEAAMGDAVREMLDDLGY